jgi:glutamate racemase
MDERRQGDTVGGGAAPVGVFDSGVGGLTILRDLLRELPSERFVYFGDTGNCPYGVREEDEIQRLALAGARLLLKRGVKIIVVACNTASVSALAELRAAYTVPFVGVVPAVKPAAERTRAGKVGIASTEASARGTYLRRLIADHANGVRVFAQGCPDLVTLAEAGTLDGPEAEAAVRAYVQPMLDAGIDKLVLGCTHFPAMRAVFERVAGPDVEVIDSGAAVARQARRVLAQRGLLAAPDGEPARAPRPPDARDEFWCSGDPIRFARVASAILGHPIMGRLAPEMRVERHAGHTDAPARVGG